MVYKIYSITKKFDAKKNSKHIIAIKIYYGHPKVLKKY